MAKIENLLSKDPIGAFEKIEANYLRYFETMFKLNNRDLDNARIEMIKNGDNLSKEPYLEILPEYTSAEGVNAITDDVIVNKFSTTFDNEERTRLFLDFVSRGLIKYPPYGHQIGMMEKAFAGIDENGNPLRYKNTVITSGTGSGKTESFLLPLLADIFKEAVSWQQINNNRADWYEQNPYIPNQRQGHERPSALRALVLYPMNALVEDQMRRLRETLDSDEIRDFMDTNLGGNRIYFGSYNGATIAPKSYDLIQGEVNGGRIERGEFTQKKRDVARELRKKVENYASSLRYYNRLDGEERNRKEDVLYIAPRLGGERATAEMVTRWDMQNWPPDILITNTSMLSIMLMRKAEAGMFEQTKRWLAAEDLPENEREEAKRDRIFHIVVDELHLYRGTAGSEVACLIRMLYDAIGLSPVVDDGNGNKIPNPQIKILASSASLGNEDDTQKFLEEFFGIYSTRENERVFNVQKGANYTGNDNGLEIDYTNFSYFTHDNFIAREFANNEEKKAFVDEFIQNNFNCENVETFIQTYKEKIFIDFYNALPMNNDAEHSRRPISKSELQRKLFANNEELLRNEEEALENSEEALRGFLIFRAYVDTIMRNHKLPRFRFHKLFKYIEGLWGELTPTNEMNSNPINPETLTYTATEVGPNGRKVLELLRCENCKELFIGGNRRGAADDQDGIYMTLNYPNLEQIPNFNPTPMVQNKSYQDYVIFWPTNENIEPLNGGGVPNGEDCVRCFDDTDPIGITYPNNGRASWTIKYLNTLTGKVQDIADDDNDTIRGYLYTINEGNRPLSKRYATPCTCPKCRQNYIMRDYTVSPIRSFRTGIDRSNQLLSKEIIYQLDGESPKLIGFSDSRSDAAKLALGIEKEHYRDMVRMLFIECVKELDVIDDIIQFIEERRNEGCSNRQIRELARARFGYINNISDIVSDYLDGENIDQYRQTRFPLSDFIGPDFNQRLVRKLIEKGINPAGEAYDVQWYGDRHNQHWSKLWNFDGDVLPDRPNDYLNRGKTKLRKAVFDNSFGKYMGVSVLDAGIGYISSPRPNDIENRPFYTTLRNILPDNIDLFDFVDAFIRVLGDNYMYPTRINNNDNNGAETYEDFRSAIKRPIRRFRELHNIDEDEFELGNALIAYLRGIQCIDASSLLQIDGLSFTMMNEDSYIRCPSCGRVHPNMGFGFCTNTYCMTMLDPRNTIPTTDLHQHFISYDILVEPRNARKLHTEELTGQTDDIQTRLQEFKDIILINNQANEPYRIGYEKTRPIDMVCVTTTMEVGVDIGSLQAIFQGNMPPTRYNYQQRVGRGGRRGQAFSAAFTFCRGRSHDNYYYKEATDEMLGGIPATPTLSLAPYRDGNEDRMKMAILKRVITKEILHKAYRELPYNYNLIDTAGEFGTIGEWQNTTSTILRNWIQNNQDNIRDIVGRYFDQFNSGGAINEDIVDIINWINNDMVNQIDNTVTRTSVTDKGLATYLSENGFLPIYGMPSDSRNFYHGVADGKVRSIDRSSEMAISEFAPGQEKIKDKGKYRIDGITVPIQDELNGGNLKFYDPDSDALSDRYELQLDNDGNFIGVRENQEDLFTDNDLRNRKNLIIPQAYRTTIIKGNRGEPIDNNDKGNFIQTQVFAEDNAQEGQTIQKEGPNFRFSIYGLGLNDDPTIWRINNNNGAYYLGKYKYTNFSNDYQPCGNRKNFMFVPNNFNGDDFREIAIGSKKITEMVKLELNGCPDTLNLSLHTGNRSAIRAAFYSAAFLLQRALADKLDVDPNEIEICEKIDPNSEYPIIYLSDALANGAGIVSYLYEGDNLENLIRSIVNFESFDANRTSDRSFMESLLNHRGECLTACQKCILTYNNRGFHHVLDWRMGVGILRLMLDPSYDFGFDIATRNEYQELQDYDLIVETCARKLGINNGLNNGLQTIIDRRTYAETYKFIYHPLWDARRAFENTRGCDCQDIQNQDIEYYNIFKVLRSNLTRDVVADNEDNVDAVDHQAEENNGESQDAVPGITLS